jgi:hypothetical protein
MVDQVAGLAWRLDAERVAPRALDELCVRPFSRAALRARSKVRK